MLQKNRNFKGIFKNLDESAIEDGLFTTKIKKVSIPSDCVGEILQFISEARILSNCLMVSKGVNSYIQKNPHCTKNIKFYLKQSPKPEQKKYVQKLYLMNRSFDEEKVFLNFPNLQYLKILGNENLSDNCLKYVPNLETLKISNCKRFTGKEIKNLTKLRYLEVDNSFYDMEGFKNVDFKQLKKMETLILRSFSDLDISMLQYLENLKVLKLYSTFFDRKSIEIQIKKKNPIFRQMKELETFIIYGSTAIDYGIFKTELKELKELKEIQFLMVSKYFRRTTDVLSILHDSFNPEFTKNWKKILITVKPQRMKRGKMARPKIF